MDTTSSRHSVCVSVSIDGLQVTTPLYELIFAHDDAFVTVCSVGGAVATLFAHSSVHSSGGIDDTTDVSPWRSAAGRDGTVTISRHVRSSLWSRKVYRFHCSPDRFVYDLEVEGSDVPAQVTYFGGYESWNPRHGSGFFPSKHAFDRVYSPEPEENRDAYFLPNENATIDIGGVPLAGKAHWFFTPPPFCFCVSSRSIWHGIGISAMAGHHNVDTYAYHGGHDHFYLSLTLGEERRRHGRYRLPSLTWDIAASAEEALRHHVARYPVPLPRAVNGDAPREPGWWREPIFCGWGEQCYAAARDHAFREVDGTIARESFLSALPHAASYATQDFYTVALAHLADHGVIPGTIVLDDKWQARYGVNDVDRGKWPDLRGFINRRHRDGQHVLLWLKAWDCEGMPADMCVVNAAGRPVAIDPTHPLMRRRIRSSVRALLSPDGYDADGFKIDFTARVPVVPGGTMHRPQTGIELLHTYLSLIYTEAKRVKPDALIVTHTPHPYLASCTDMIRLNDMLTLYREKDDRPDPAWVRESVTRRSDVARSVFPGRPIDTDNWPVGNLASWRDYVSIQTDVGVPSLYYASHIDATEEPFEERDYALLRTVWRAYRRRLRRTYGAGISELHSDDHGVA